MKKVIITLGIVLCYSFLFNASAEYKVYLIHGYGGSGRELVKIQKAIEANGYSVERFSYKSLKKDVDSVGKTLANKLKKETADTVSFVTHSMGGIVVRAMYNYIDETDSIPYIKRIVMIAPPNNGSPVADFYEQFSVVKLLVGPNINNLTTDSVTGANKYPVPDCEIGVVIGKVNRKHCFTVPLNGDNDGIVLNESSILGVEQDICYVENSHIALLFNQNVKTSVVSFLNNGRFN